MFGFYDISVLPCAFSRFYFFLCGWLPEQLLGREQEVPGWDASVEPHTMPDPLCYSPAQGSVYPGTGARGCAATPKSVFRSASAGL